MKKFSLYISALVLGALALQSCEDNWVNPPMDVPQFPAGTEANMTLAELKAKYWQDTNSYGTVIGLNDSGDSITVMGTIVSSDQSGNIYKTLILQDQSAAITIGINSADLYEEYPMGLAMAVNVTGMTIGRYNGLVQLGTYTSSGVNRIELADFQPHAMVDASKGKIDTTLTTIAELEASKSKEDLIKWQSRLVRIDSISFREAGQPFTTGETTSRNIVDADGNRMIVYNSSYSDFAYDKLPKGKGSVVGILSSYRDTWQILLIDANSCIGFDGQGEDTPDAPSGEAVTSIDEKFSTEIPATWSQVQIAGNKSWYWREFNGIGYATVSGYNGSAPFDQWLVSPCIDLDKAEKKVLSFDTQVNGYGSTTTQFEVYVMTAPDTKGTNTKLNPALAVAPDSGYSSWVKSGNIDLSAFSGKVYIGFRYQATEAANYATWCVTNVLLGKDSSAAPDAPVTPPSDGTTFLAESSANGADGWTFEYVTKPEGLQYDLWQWKNYNSKYYLNASAYASGTSYASESYAVSPVIDLSTASKVSASFDHAAKFQTTVRTLCGFAVREAGTTAWTMLTIPTWPDAGSWTFVNSGAIDLSAYAGKKVQVAFKYGSSTDGADTWEIKNLVINK